jgi:hypothetical protein
MQTSYPANGSSVNLGLLICRRSLWFKVLSIANASPAAISAPTLDYFHSVLVDVSGNETEMAYNR